MIAPRDATAETMLAAIAYTLGALHAASQLDADRTEEDRQFFGVEKQNLSPFFDDLLAADQALTKHTLLVMRGCQAGVEIGDAVLDRGVRTAKSRMRLELKSTAALDGADAVFPSDIREITDAERRVEPSLVLKVVERFGLVPDFAGKDALKADLEARANKQNESFAARDAAEVTEAKLDSELSKAIAQGSDTLYKLEKRLLERFPRDKVYVRAFFLDVAAGRKKKAPEPAPTP